MNKKVSFPIAIIIIVVCVVLVGGIVVWQYLEMRKEEVKEKIEKEEIEKGGVEKLEDIQNLPKDLQSLAENLIIACETKNQDKIEEYKISLWEHLREKPSDGEYILLVIQDQNNPDVLNILVGALTLPVFRNNEQIEKGMLDQMKLASKNLERRRILSDFFSGNPDLSPNTVEVLVGLATDEPDATVMQNIMTAVGQHATDEYCAPLFAYWAKRHPDPIVRVSALRKLPLYVDNPAMNVEVAIDGLGDQSPKVRVAAVEVLNDIDSSVFETRHFEKVREALIVEKDPEIAKDIISFMACTWPDKAPDVLRAFIKIFEDDEDSSVKLYAECFIEIIQEGVRDKELLLEKAYDCWQEKLYGQ